MTILEFRKYISKQLHKLFEEQEEKIGIMKMHGINEEKQQEKKEVHEEPKELHTENK